MTIQTSSNLIKKAGAVNDFKHFESDVEVVADTIIIDGLDPKLHHNHIGVQFFSDAAGLVPAVPGAGSINVDLKTLNTQVFEPAPTTNIPGTGPITLDNDFPAIEYRGVPTGITTATHWKMVVTQTRN